jgi:opacity protein-like surface antigen
LALALILAASPALGQATSDQRIPVRKDQGITYRESLEALANTYQQRLYALESAYATLDSRSLAAARRISTLEDSLRLVNAQLVTARADFAAMRAELMATSNRAVALENEVQHLNQRFDRFTKGSLFGNSGFYMGLGTGANVTTGDLRDLNYGSALHVQVPIGFARLGNLVGFRTEWAFQQLEGQASGIYHNPDPEILSGVAMVTLNFPMNTAKNNIFYVMGGGGVYHFRDIGMQSSLASSFPDITPSSDNETKWGLTGGAGLEFHILGAASLYVQSQFTNVSAKGRDLNWVPLIAGLQLR